MYLQVYLHRATRATEALVINIFKLAADIAEQDELPRDTPPAVQAMFGRRGDIDLATYLQLDDFVVINTLSGWSELERQQAEPLQSLVRMCD